MPLAYQQNAFGPAFTTAERGWSFLQAFILAEHRRATRTRHGLPAAITSFRWPCRVASFSSITQARAQIATRAMILLPLLHAASIDEEAAH